MWLETYRLKAENKWTKFDTKLKNQLFKRIGFWVALNFLTVSSKRRVISQQSREEAHDMMTEYTIHTRSDTPSNHAHTRVNVCGRGLSRHAAQEDTSQEASCSLLERVTRQWRPLLAQLEGRTVSKGPIHMPEDRRYCSCGRILAEQNSVRGC